MTKTTTRGTMLVTPPGVRTIMKKLNGEVTSFSYAAKAPYQRRFGRTSTITSQSGRDGRFRPCTHVQESYAVSPLSALTRFQEYRDPATSPSSNIEKQWYYDLVSDVHARYYSDFTTGAEMAAVPLTSVQWNTLGATALQNMMPSFNGGDSSLLNFILELKDFKDVWKYIAQGFIKKVDRLQAFRVKGRDGRERSLWTDMDKGKPLQKLSRYYLAYNFGWRPLYNDVVSLVESLTGFKKRYDELVRRQNKPQQRYWGTWVAGTAAAEVTRFSRTVGPSGSWYGPFLAHCRYRVVQEASEGIRYHASLRYRYKLPKELFEAGGRAKAHLDLLGVSRNPAILWNAIPFSFIIDWVVNVNKYLERLKSDNIQIQTELLDFCHSARSERKVRLDISADNWFKPSPYTYMAWQTTDICVKKAYQRRTGIPDLFTAITTSGLNPREFSIAGALVGARKGY